AGSLHRLCHALLVEGLEQVIHRIDLERFHCVLVESRGEDDLREGNLPVEKFFDDAEAVESGHLDVEKDDVRAMFFDEADGLETIFPLRYDIDVAAAFEQVREFIASELL